MSRRAPRYCIVPGVRYWEVEVEAEVVAGVGAGRSWEFSAMPAGEGSGLHGPVQNTPYPSRHKVAAQQVAEQAVQCVPGHILSFRCTGLPAHAQLLLVELHPAGAEGTGRPTAAKKHAAQRSVIPRSTSMRLMLLLPAGSRPVTGWQPEQPASELSGSGWRLVMPGWPAPCLAALLAWLLTEHLPSSIIINPMRVNGAHQ